MTTVQMLDSARLFPSLGRFGSLESDCLKIQLGVGARAQRIRVVIPAEFGPMILNLRGVKFLGPAGDTLNPSGAARQSSVFSDDHRHGPFTLLEMKGIHTKQEISPHWEIAFTEPQEIAEIHLYNRGDVWGARSKAIRIEVMSSDGVWKTHHSGQSVVYARSCLQTVGSWLGPSLFSLCEMGDGDGLRREIVRHICARLEESDREALVDVPWTPILSLVPVDKGALWSGDEFRVVATLLLCQQMYTRRTSLMEYANVLRSRELVARLQAEVNAVADRLGVGDYMITRHGLQGVRLRRMSAAYVDHMREVLNFLSAQDVEACIGYGTLLGAIRDKHFIAHDDDVDLIYRMKIGCGWDAAIQSQQQLAERLRAVGYKVVLLAPNSLNMHITDPQRNTVIDLFPSWEDEGNSFMHMRGMRIETVPVNVMWPVSKVNFLGHDFPAPAAPDEFLLIRYGAGWTVSDQFFEWPWSLD